MLIEWVFGIGLTLILGSLTFHWNLLPLREKSAAVMGSQTLQLKRMTAIATDQDIGIYPSEIAQLSPQVSSRINVSQLGFKASGNTQRAGTILIGSTPYRVSLGVGYGKVRRTRGHILLELLLGSALLGITLSFSTGWIESSVRLHHALNLFSTRLDTAQIKMETQSSTSQTRWGDLIKYTEPIDATHRFETLRYVPTR
jgi:hypothetical protein